MRAGGSPLFETFGNGLVHVISPPHIWKALPTPWSTGHTKSVGIWSSLLQTIRLEVKSYSGKVSRKIDPSGAILNIWIFIFAHFLHQNVPSLALEECCRSGVGLQVGARPVFPESLMGVLLRHAREVLLCVDSGTTWLRVRRSHRANSSFTWGNFERLFKT